jgi:hypothetical protein
MAQELATDAGNALQRFTCTLVRLVIASMKTKVKLKGTFRKLSPWRRLRFQFRDPTDWMNSEGRLLRPPGLARTA